MLNRHRQAIQQQKECDRAMILFGIVWFAVVILIVAVNA